MSKAEGESPVEMFDAWTAPLSNTDPRSTRQQVIFLFGAGISVGVHLGLLYLYLFRSTAGFFVILGVSLFYSTVTLFLWKWIMPRFSTVRNPLRLIWHIVISVAAYAVASLLTIEAHAMLLGGNSLLYPYNGPDLTFTIPAGTVRNAPIVYSLIPILPMALLCVTGFNLYWWRILILQSRARELRDLAVSSQLAALRAQINPHFLFNSLNSIAQLISVDPGKAERCVERLSDIFRYLLTRSQVEFVSVADEMELVDAYLEIERTRFGDELTIHSHVDDRARPLQIPALILQPLIENAVKHGISQKIGGGTVYISAAVDGADLCLTVRDTGIGIHHEGSVYERGIGLRSVRDRLVRWYGPAYKPSIESVAGRGTTVSLRIPARSSIPSAGVVT